ncbi:hypothetical protein [Candidatus Rhabdochlamydia sp. T3358]|uniref:hypothetical protein n=1 Tax=Candidatus Rhabdochlamydia sp. T3358 TaxID=2099795 RepID=UPI0010B1C8C0|nr:hypothetical protein [Candidatus Rhabdochlamydia sp. T3358]VHO04049.1 hypothetical protein RHT_01198 [Candidatus Rhabdochlamydia sp. T3358]
MTTHLEQAKQFLESNAEYKETHLSEILELINDLMLTWKNAIIKGSKEEQTQAIERLNQVRGLLKDYFEKVKENLGLSPEEIEQLVEYATKKNTPNQEKIVSFSKEFKKHSDEILEIVGRNKKIKKQRAPRASWISS